MEWALALVALALIGVAAISGRLSGTPITPAMLFVAFGLVVGPQVLDGIDLASSGSTVRALAEGTLALVLFTDTRSQHVGHGVDLMTYAAVRHAVIDWLNSRMR